MPIVVNGIVLVVEGTIVATSDMLTGMETSVFEFSSPNTMLEEVDIVERGEEADVIVGASMSLVNIPLPSSQDIQLGSKSKQ